MIGSAVLGSFPKRAAFALVLVMVMSLMLAAVFRYATPLDGIPDTYPKSIDAGWFYEDAGTLCPIGKLPCTLEHNGETLYMVRELSDLPHDSDDILAVETRYQSIRVWADDEVIYEAAQGKEHALSTMWHFIASERYDGATEIRIELTKYDGDLEWSLNRIFQDHPDAIKVYLLEEHIPILIVWLCCMLFALLLMFGILFMAVKKVAGITTVISLASFIFLSGSWILFDSKITTIFGGNYAFTYFLSYAVFYLMPVPLLFFFQLILNLQSRLPRILTWVTAINAAFWMLMHLLGIVDIRDTAVCVHLIIIAFVVLFIVEFFKKRTKRLIFTFCGIFLLFVLALASIVLYYAGLLPPSNSAILFVWSLPALILCMVMDTMLIVDNIWKEQQFNSVYRQLATEDSMTRLANRNAYELRLRELVSGDPCELSFVLFDIDRMKYINDTYGHHIGDQVIELVAQCIFDTFGNCGDCYRIGGDEFCVIATNCNDIPGRLKRFDELVASRNDAELPLDVSYGWDKQIFRNGKSISLKAIIDLKTSADKQLYLHKNSKNCDTPHPGQSAEESSGTVPLR